MQLIYRTSVLHYNIFIISISIIINKNINLFLLINADKTRDPDIAYRLILAEENDNDNSVKDNHPKVPGLFECKLIKLWIITQCPGLVHCQDKYMDTFRRKGQVMVVETNYGHLN